MHLPHTLALSLLAVLSWGAAVVLTALASPCKDEMRPAKDVLGIRDSAYGLQVASLIRPTLDHYWHMGQDRLEHDHESETPNLSVPDHSNDDFFEVLQHLGERRFERTNEKPMPPALYQYAKLSSRWRLRLALALAPDDWVLLDIYLDDRKLRHANQPKQMYDESWEWAGPAIEAALKQKVPTIPRSMSGAVGAAQMLELPDIKYPQMVSFTQQLGECLARVDESILQSQLNNTWQFIPAVKKNDIVNQINLLKRYHESYVMKCDREKPVLLNN